MNQTFLPGVMDKSYAAERLSKPHLSFRFRFRAAEAYDAFLRHSKPSPHIQLLDMGAAEGLTLLELSRLFRNEGSFTGIEYAEDLILKAPALPENIKLLQGNVCHLGDLVRNESIDVITALAVLEHLPEPVEALKEAQRILKPGGLFIASCPDPFWDKLAGSLGLMKGEYHESSFDRNFFRSVMEKAGLEFLEYRRFMWVLPAYLPYLRLKVELAKARILDESIRGLPFASWMFINQLAVARKK